VRTDEQRAEIRRGCDRFLQLYGGMSIADELASLAEVAADREPDRYGGGELIEELEHRLAELFGTEAAAFLPSGTMAQQIALRVWADETGINTVALHGLAHLQMHELDAAWELHHLRPRFLTHEPRHATVDELAEIAEPLGSVTVELPLRDADLQLPTWDELSTFGAAARERAARVHFDGARLWESTDYLGHSLAEVAALADSVYVSFYKILGAMSGSALVGSAAFIAQVRRWRTRHGGTLFAQFPAVLGALRGLDTYLPRTPDYVAHARKLAAGLGELPSVRVNPDPPHSSGFVVYADVPTDRLDEATMLYAQERHTWTLSWQAAQVPGWSRAELHVGEATMTWTPEEVTALLAELIATAAPKSGG
jgi:threonine aldolase